jgi:hypothetical protein
MVRSASWCLALLAVAALAAGQVFAQGGPPPPLPHAGAGVAAPAGQGSAARPAPVPAPLPRAPTEAELLAAYDAPPRARPAAPRWDVRLEGGLGFLPGPKGSVGVPPGTGSGLVWDVLPYPVGYGVRALGAYHLGPCDRVELGGAYYGTWDGSRQVQGDLGTQNDPGGPVNVAAGVTGTLAAESQVWDAEGTWWRRLGYRECGGYSPCTWLGVGAGLRYLRLNEDARGAFRNAQAVPFTFDADATNQFFAVQLGGRAEAVLAPRFTLGLTVMALAGAVDRKVSVSDFGVFSPGPNGATDQATGFGWGVDVDLSARWQVSRCWYVSVGYQFLFVDEVQRAWDALDFSRGGTGAVQARRATDSLLLNSLFLGIGWTP